MKTSLILIVIVSFVSCTQAQSHHSKKFEVVKTEAVSTCSFNIVVDVFVQEAIENNSSKKTGIDIRVFMRRFYEL